MNKGILTFNFEVCQNLLGFAWGSLMFHNDKCFIMQKNTNLDLWSSIWIALNQWQNWSFCCGKLGHDWMLPVGIFCIVLYFIDKYVITKRNRKSRITKKTITFKLNHNAKLTFNPGWVTHLQLDLMIVCFQVV